MKKSFLIIAAVGLVIIAFSSDCVAQGNIAKSELSNFEATQKGNAIQLSWNALYEADVYTHEIQKSANGSSFTNIGTLAAHNNPAPYHYTFIDATPVYGINYYRLRTVDRKGDEHFSNIIQVNNGAGRTDVRILPNPVRGGILNLQLLNISSGKYAVSLYGNGGQKVFARSLDVSSGSLTETINLPQTLTPGIYFLQFTNGDMRINREVVVQ
ncbi:MAG: T9SS type A sorting domain-containing protein [Bacteroidota bacterium]|nr:T9SS type A sorting domain-containing protein [Bacteroidota bacterium]